MNDTKIILLIGRSGRGKSTLANVLTDTNNFKESSGSVSETKEVQCEQFVDEENSINYQIIDTPGIGDTKMSDNEVLNIIAKAVYLGKDGISQVFFVNDGRFDQYEMATYDLLRTIIFDNDITKHTTIVRTRFPEFRDDEEYQKDIDSMTKEAQEKEAELRKNIADKKKELESLPSSDEQYQRLSEEIKKAEKELTVTNLAKIIESCQGRIIYVDNPSLEVKDANKLKMNKEDREDSREILLEHLKEHCLGDSYKPENLKKLSEDIADDYFQYLNKKAELQKELDEEMKRLNSRTKASISQAPLSQTSSVNFPSDQTELTSEEKPTKIQEKVIIIEKEKRDKIIAQLQDKKARLTKEIQEKEKIIHQKVLKHIFNNYEAINKELGGNIFLSSVAGEHPWPEIHPEFANKEIVLRWLKEGFDYEQTQKWATALIDFNPRIDADFCAWLRDKKQLTVEGIKRASYPQNIERWRNEYGNYLEKETEILGKHNEQLASGKENNAQQWLEKNYPPETRSTIKELNLNGKELEGSLDLSDFINLQELNCSHNQLAKLEINNCSDLRKIHCYKNKLSILNISNLNKLELLNCPYNQLTSLNLNNCSRLKELKCGCNQLTKLDLINLYELRKLSCNNNYIENLDYSSLDPAKLVYLSIGNNNLNPGGSQDLTVFSPFVNLEGLWIGNSDQVELEEKKCNRFHGSLEPLKGLTNLKFLDISNINIDSNVEYLPKSIGEIYYTTGGELEDKMKKVVELKNYSYTGNSTKYVAINNAQQFLNESYLKGDKSKITEINISYKQSKTPLNLNDFSNLENLNFYGNDLITLGISNCPKLKTIQCSNNSNLTNLILNNCPEITVLKCNSNNFASLDFLTGLISKKLELLDISNNNIQLSDLTSFGCFTNLKSLNLGNHDEDKIKKGIYNHFVGSLEPLRKLSKLEHLFISNTDIDSGWEYLPDGVNKFECSVGERPWAKVKIIQEKLRKIGEPKHNNFANIIRDWKKAQQNQLTLKIFPSKFFS